MTTSYIRLVVSVFNTDHTPNEIRRAILNALLNALPDEELEVNVDEHTETCSDDVCGEQD